MSTPGMSQTCFSFDSVITPLADGSWKVRAGRPRPVEDRVSVRQAARELAYSERQVRRILLEQARPYQRRRGCKLWISRSELERLKTLTAC